MTGERWQQVKAVLGEALEAPPAERGALLDRVCRGDIALRTEVESLLAAADDGDDSLPDARHAIAAEAAAVIEGGPEADSALRSILETALGQQYEILRPLGRGGMGAVYLARERALERFVAVKVLRPDLAALAASRERFRREARIAAQLSHPGILPLHTFGEVGGVWYFVMGYVRGESLAQRLRLEGRLPSDEARRILAALADALDCAHRHGVVHRDIKPANILLDDESGRPMLADFGISKIQGAGDSLTASGAVVGTPHYMSPEQSLGSSDVDERSDVYSLGVVGYAMLAGREPFAGVSADELVYRRLSHDAPALETVAPSVPEDLAAVVMRCLARDRAMRWPDARSLKDALDRTGVELLPVLPEELRDLPGFGPYALAWAVIWIALAVLTPRFTGDRVLLLLIALLVPVGLALHVWNIGRHGLSSRQLVQVACWPPQWWGMWWPRALRRPSDLWSRLPWPARLARVVLSTFFFALPATVLVRHRLASHGVLSSGDGMQHWFAAAEWTLVLASAVLIGGSLLWALGRGLSFAEAVYVLFGGTVPSPVWRRPRVSLLLAPAARGVRPPDRDTPSDYPRAIEDLVRVLPRDAAAVGADAARSSRALLAAMVRADREVESLARDASTAELERLSTQLAALEEGSSRDVEERRELRELVRHQLDVVRRMRGRHELALQHRAHLFDLLRGLWTQLCLVPDSTGDVSGESSASESVRALCGEIEEALAHKGD